MGFLKIKSTVFKHYSVFLIDLAKVLLMGRTHFDMVFRKKEIAIRFLECR